MEGRGGVVGEIRRLNIIYFLCSLGRIDHPHLIRVHHLNRNGVFLRDIKRWLADLRGKDMPETFTWSYKRRYKKGYVWQDLLDDDLITPISDNEYVLKGSQILSYSSFAPPHSYLYAAEKKRCLLKELQPPNSEEAPFQMHHITKTSFETDQQESPPHNSGSSLIDADAVNIRGDQKCSSSSSTIKANSTNHEQSKDKSSIENSCFYSHLLLKKKSSSVKDKDSKEMGCSSTTSSSSSSPHNSSPQSQSVPLGKSTKKQHLSMFRNLINCGAVDTNDTVFVRLNRDSKTYSTNNNKPLNRSRQDIIIRKEKREKAGTVGYAGLFRTCMNQQERPQQPQNHTTTASKSDDRNQKIASSTYRPVRGPHCSHCRKQFKPEKLHSHMKSCKGIKALSKTAPDSVVKMP
ncbi:protein SOSEKI 1 [Rosa rugosa]|uniref:protein SOSEKI 1 n=1 Tax=Rosa rugosa TaxID=74645 RepID=UPI002B413661|nr:protein SOSEKI 1 [Rosa rugosa]